ncbi:hypothetical protein, partial [Saccharopolyspora shandongensis]|uniref:WXG100-like domain-containing protein n=1 Tax=Saccharopolyspora shandongensis TaxID=418495 RepID=UPI0033C16178
MSMYIPPDQAKIFAGMTGSQWPEADEDALRALQPRYELAASSLMALQDDLLAYLQEVKNGFEGSGAQAYVQVAKQLTEPDPKANNKSPLEATALAAQGFGDFLYETAAQVTYMKAQAIGQLILMAMELAALLVMMFVFPEASGIITGMMAAIREITSVILRFLLELLVHTIMQIIFNTVSGVLLDVLIQGAMLAQGLEHSWNSQNTASAAEGGVIAGAMGGLAVMGGQGLGKLVSKTLGKGLGVFSSKASSFFHGFDDIVGNNVKNVFKDMVGKGAGTAGKDAAGNLAKNESKSLADTGVEGLGKDLSNTTKGFASYFLTGFGNSKWMYKEGIGTGISKTLTAGAGTRFRDQVVHSFTDKLKDVAAKDTGKAIGENTAKEIGQKFSKAVVENAGKTGKEGLEDALSHALKPYRKELGDDLYDSLTKKYADAVYGNEKNFRGALGHQGAMIAGSMPAYGLQNLLAGGVTSWLFNPDHQFEIEWQAFTGGMAGAAFEVAGESYLTHPASAYMNEHNINIPAIFKGNFGTSNTDHSAGSAGGTAGGGQGESQPLMQDNQLDQNFTETHFNDSDTGSIYSDTSSNYGSWQQHQNHDQSSSVGHFPSSVPPASSTVVTSSGPGTNPFSSPAPNSGQHHVQTSSGPEDNGPDLINLDEDQTMAVSQGLIDITDPSHNEPPAGNGPKPPHNSNNPYRQNQPDRNPFRNPELLRQNQQNPGVEPPQDEGNTPHGPKTPLDEVLRQFDPLHQDSEQQHSQVQPPAPPVQHSTESSPNLQHTDESASSGGIHQDQQNDPAPPKDHHPARNDQGQHSGGKIETQTGIHPGDNRSSTRHVTRDDSTTGHSDENVTNSQQDETGLDETPTRRAPDNDPELMPQVLVSLLTGDAAPQQHGGVLEPDYFGLLKAQEVPEFLAGQAEYGENYSNLNAGQGIQLLEQLDLAKATAPEADSLTSHALDNGRLPVITKDTTRPNYKDWHPNQWSENQNLPELPDRLELPRVRHSIWFGGAVTGNENPANGRGQLAKNLELSAKELGGNGRVVLWTDVPRGEFAKPGSDAAKMADWARRNNIVLANIHEVFNAGAPMVLHTQFSAELNKGVGRGFAAASDIARVEILKRFGGVYSDGEHVTNELFFGDAKGRFLEDPESYGVNRRGGPGGSIGNDLFVIPKGHPFTDVYLEHIAGNYRKTQDELAPSLRPLLKNQDQSEIDKFPGLRFRTNSVMLRTGPDALNDLAQKVDRQDDYGRIGDSVFPSVPSFGMDLSKGSLSWTDRRLPEPTIGFDDLPATVKLTKQVVQTLVRELYNRDGDLHLTLVHELVAKHRNPDEIWTAALGYIASRPELAEMVTSVTDVTTIAGEPGTKSVERPVQLPAAALRHLNIDQNAPREHRIGEYSRPATMVDPSGDQELVRRLPQRDQHLDQGADANTLSENQTGFVEYDASVQPVEPPTETVTSHTEATEQSVESGSLPPLETPQTPNPVPIQTGQQQVSVSSETIKNELHQEISANQHDQGDAFTGKLGADPFGVRQKPPAPGFLQHGGKGYDYSKLHADKRDAFFEQLDMTTGKQPTWESLRPENLASREDSVTSGTITTRAKGPGFKFQKVPHLVHSVALGGPLHDDGGRRAEFMHNFGAAAAKEGPAGFKFMVWTDVPRADFERVAGMDSPQGHDAQVKQMLDWAKANNVRLINLDEVFNQHNPMKLDPQVRTERARGAEDSYTSASGMLRAEIADRIGGVYHEGNNKLAGDLAGAVRKAAGHRLGFLPLADEHGALHNSALISAAGTRATRKYVQVLGESYAHDMNDVAAITGSNGDTFNQLARSLRFKDVQGNDAYKKLPALDPNLIEHAGSQTERNPLPASESVGQQDVSAAVRKAVVNLHAELPGRDNRPHLPGAARVIETLPPEHRTAAWTAAVELFHETLPSNTEIHAALDGFDELPSAVQLKLHKLFPEAGYPDPTGPPKQQTLDREAELRHNTGSLRNNDWMRPYAKPLKPEDWADQRDSARYVTVRHTARDALLDVKPGDRAGTRLKLPPTTPLLRTKQERLRAALQEKIATHAVVADKAKAGFEESLQEKQKIQEEIKKDLLSHFGKSVKGEVAYDLREFQMSDGRAVLEFTHKIHLKGADGRQAEVQRRTSELLDELVNKYGYRLPTGEQLYVRLEFVGSADEAHNSVNLLEATSGRGTDQRNWVMAPGLSGDYHLNFVHEVLHGLGLLDEYLYDHKDIAPPVFNADRPYQPKPIATETGKPAPPPQHRVHSAQANIMGGALRTSPGFRPRHAFQIGLIAAQVGALHHLANPNTPNGHLVRTEVTGEGTGYVHEVLPQLLQDELGKSQEAGRDLFGLGEKRSTAEFLAAHNDPGVRSIDHRNWDATVELTKHVVQQLVDGLHRDGILHLTKVQDLVARHQQQDAIWTAALGYLSARPDLAGLVRHVADAAEVRPTDKTFQGPGKGYGPHSVELPEQARRQLRIDEKAKVTRWGNEFLRPAKLASTETGPNHGTHSESARNEQDRRTPKLAPIKEETPEDLEFDEFKQSRSDVLSDLLRKV